MAVEAAQQLPSRLANMPGFLGTALPNPDLLAAAGNADQGSLTMSMLVLQGLPCMPKVKVVLFVVEQTQGMRDLILVWHTDSYGSPPLCSCTVFLYSITCER